MKTVPVESTAEAYVELLAARGVDYFFGNAGTDFGPIVDVYAKRLAMELPLPKPVTVPHEITAMAMAAGYAMVTRKPQVVMVHTIPGTANATGGLINARSNNVPMLFSAGRTPITEAGMKGSRNGGIHWAPESVGPGSMVREWVKWDYELRHGADLEGVVDRALAITQSEPQGPAYLTLPREVLAEERESFSYSEQPRMRPNLSMASPDAIREAARVLARAKNPTAIAQAVGRGPEAGARGGGRHGAPGDRRAVGAREGPRAAPRRDDHRPRRGPAVHRLPGARLPRRRQPRRLAPLPPGGGLERPQGRDARRRGRRGARPPLGGGAREGARRRG